MEQTEHRVDRRKVILGLLFASAAGIAAWRQPSIRLDYLGSIKLEDLVPPTIGKWKFVTNSGLVVPPKDEWSDSLYSQLLTRVYSDGENPPVMLLIAQSASQTGVLQVHRPEVCYPTGGFSLSPVVPHAVQVGPMTLLTNSLVAVGGGVTESIVYWTRIGDSLPLSWLQQRIDVARQNLQGVIPDAVLVRVSIRQGNTEAARTILNDFVRELLAAVPADKRSFFTA